MWWNFDIIVCKPQGGLDHVKSQIPQWGKEADRMHEAVQKTDEVSIVRVLARFTNKQRTKLMKTYKEKFDEVSKEYFTEQLLFS